MFALGLALLAVISVRVDALPGHHVNSIRPIRALGAGIDSDPTDKVRLLYGPARTRRMLAAGLGSLSYRLYTELSIQDWHWNPAGAYSEPGRSQGYWTSNDRANGAPIVDSFGYRLPRRGSTRDQGDDDGYSRLDDGDATTFWKSDPYLARPYTHESDALHPQWAVIDFGTARAVDAVRIAWARPYATRYALEFWTGRDAILEPARGAWHAFPQGSVEGGRGGTVTLRLTQRPVLARFFRLSMSQSSYACPAGRGADGRDCAGYAIYELGLGRLGAGREFVDLVRHARCGGNPLARSRCGARQTTIFTSSDDPWHREGDRVGGGGEQTGLDFVARNPVTHGLPVMYPVPLFYSTPENAAAEIRYLEARGYPIAYVEMGEEVDGQYATPEDYGALYVQWARAIAAVDPAVRLGGPVFEGVNSDVGAWRDAAGDASWLHRFLRYLKNRDALGRLSFMSFEHYPFKGCDAGPVLDADLLREPALMRGIVAIWRADGVPADVPLMVTEGNFASDGGPVPQRLEGALWWADYIGSALTAGVSRVYHYQYEAEPLDRARECGAYGNYGMFVTDGRYRIRAEAAQFHAVHLVTQRWLEPGDRIHRIYRATTSLGTLAPAVTAYAAARPDGSWSLLLVNKSRFPQRVRTAFVTADGARTFAGPVDVYAFGPSQYGWQGRASDELPRPGSPERHTVARGGPGARFAIPARALVVLRGRLGAPLSAPSASRRRY